MTLLLERPTTGQETPEEFEGEYLFFEGSAILGRTSEDCWVCGWKFGYPRWPNCTMALHYPDKYGETVTACYGRGAVCRWVFFEGQTILGDVFKDCMFCALQAAKPSWPAAEIAVVVPTEPADIYLSCRNKRRRQAQ